MSNANDSGKWTAADEAEFLKLLEEQERDAAADLHWSDSGASGSLSGAIPAKSGAATWGRSCCHTLDPIEMSDGTILHASDYYSSGKRIEFPDVGFYLDRAWHPHYFAYMVEWEDFGLPECNAAVIQRYARAALRHARDGEIVDIACLGSHGRTGTFLAICDLLTMEMPDGDLAIDNIRRKHCSKAIETAEQEWYVLCIAALLTDCELPEHPREIAKRNAAMRAKNVSKKGGKKRKR